MLRYAITDRHLLPGGESGAGAGAPSLPRSLRQGWDHAPIIARTRHWAAQSIDYIQIREKDLSPNDLRNLTEQIVSAVREHGARTKILLNGPAEIALETGADGIHLPASIPPSVASEARSLYAQSGREAIISHSCHSTAEVLRVREESQRDSHASIENTLILYAPVFEKLTSEGKLPGQGLEALHAAIQAAGNIPILALGGITNENASACLAAGAAGIAGIRLFLPDHFQFMGSS